MRYSGTLRKDKLTWKDRWKIAGKVLVGFCCLVCPVERPIFIFSTRRSGSTLLMRVLHSQPGVDYISEPLNLWRLHPHFWRLPHPPSGYFISLTDAEEERLYGYLRDLLSGKLRFRHRGNLLDPGRTFLVRRFVVKNINATPLIDWFAEKFDADIIYLLRHPGAVAESLLRKGWNSTARVYLEDSVYSGNLTAEQRELAQRILEKGSSFQQCILEWCLDNLYPLSVWKERPWLTLSYEELVMRPQEMSRLLCQRLGLSDPGRMQRVLQLPSRTTSVDSKAVIRAEGPRALIGRWLKHINKTEIEGMKELLNAFGIEIYRADSPYPIEVLCHFGPLAEGKL